MHNQMRGVSLIFFFFFYPRYPITRQRYSRPDTHIHTQTHKKWGFRTWQEVCICVDMHRTVKSVAFHTAEADEHRWRFSAFRLAKRTPGGRWGLRGGGSVSPQSNAAAARGDVHAHAACESSASTAQLTLFQNSGRHPDDAAAAGDCTIFLKPFSLFVLPY